MTSSRQGLFIQNEYFDHEKSNSDGTLFSIVPRGFITYRHMSDDDIFHFNINILCDYGLVSKEYPVFTTDSELDTNLLVEHLNSSKDFLSFCKRQKKGGTRTRLYFNVLGDYQIAIPERDEQKKVAQFLDLINARIAFQQRFIDALKSYKRGFEEALFDHFLSDEENTVIPLGELGFFYGGLSGKSKEDFGVGSALYIPYMNVYKNTFADTDACENVKIRAGEKQNTVRFGDLLFTQSSETTEEVGLTSVWLSTTQPYLNSFCFGFRPNSGYPIDPYYLGYLMRSHRVRTAIMREGQGATRVNLSPERLKDIHISLPHYPQQKYLGALLFKFDQRIKNEELVLEAIKLQRKGLVSKLFV